MSASWTSNHLGHLIIAVDHSRLSLVPQPLIGEQIPRSQSTPQIPPQAKTDARESFHLLLVDLRREGHMYAVEVVAKGAEVAPKRHSPSR